LRFQDIIDGNILGMADKVMDILKTKYLISPIKYAGLQRIETLEIPEDALREAIFNAIGHKDYTGAPIQLSVYNDKLILWNEGRLPEGFTVQTLLEKHPSIPYNKTVAEIFFKAGFIEAWGRGISKIITGFKLAKLPVPDFEAKMGGIVVTVYRKSRENEGLNDRQKTTKKDHVVENVIDHVVENVIDNVTEDRQLQILNYIKKNQYITTKELAKHLKVSRRTIMRDIDQLKTRKKLKRIGGDKGGYWEIINE
jgi:ATP-dependent DNA helicase RecG